MNRLTRDLKTPHDDTTYADIVKDCVDRENIVLTKLKHLEDIEEELGVDLITFIKILSADTLYKKSGDEICEIFSVKNMEAIFDKNCFVAHDGYYNCSMHDVYCYLHLKDYGKTWALTKEELEEE